MRHTRFSLLARAALLLSVLLLPQTTAMAAETGSHLPKHATTSITIPPKPKGGMLTLQAFTMPAAVVAERFDASAVHAKVSGRSLSVLPPADSVDVQTSSVYWYGDYLFVDGVVTNTYPYALNSVQVTVTLKDTLGTVTDTTTSPVAAYRIGQGEYASFTTQFYLPGDEGTYSVDALGYQEYDSMPVALTPGNNSYAEEDSVRVYSRVFRNDSPYTVEQPILGGWELDAENTLIDTFFDFDDTAKIPPGGSWISEFAGFNAGGVSDYADAYAEAWPVSYTIAPGKVTRVAGSARWDVAANLARKGWDATNNKSWTGVHDVIIANGENGKEADPLSAAGLAGAYGAPVLLTAAATLPAATKLAIAEIAKANPGVRIHLIGGTSSVPDARWYQIKVIPGVSATKDRLAGGDRYDVSAAIANRIVSLVGADAIQGFMLIAADNPAAFYDALAASPIAYANTMPMLSVRKSSVPTSVYAVLKSAALVGKPRYAASSATYIGAGALSGAMRLTTSSNRYTAANVIARYAIGKKWARAADTGLAAKLPDALTGGTYLGKVGGVLLFTDSSTAVQSSSRSFITGNKTHITNGWVVGGTGSVPAAQETSFRSVLK